MKKVTAADLPFSGDPSQPLYTDLHHGQVYYRLGRYYCTRMSRMGKCTRRCQDCAANIANILSVVQDRKPDTRDPLGLLVWAIREETAKIAEQNELTSTMPERDWLGETTDRNIFEIFAEALP